MTISPETNKQDNLERYLNSFATQSFRDQADRDYIAARLACRFELMPQFLWASHQAVEKYFKAILLYNKIRAKSVGHDLVKAQALTKELSFKIELSCRSQKFLDHLSQYGEFRYIDVPYNVHGYALIDLDFMVWELRRYCQVLNVFGKVLPADEQTRLNEAKLELFQSTSKPKHNFRLNGGLLEKILENKSHPSRPALLWNNPVFGLRKRSIVRSKHLFYAENPLMYLYPEMLDELLKYVFIPDKLAKVYRAHLANIKANPDARP
jgi:HEPN domain-containing protein